MSLVQGSLTCWKRVYSLLLELKSEVHPLDSSETAFFMLKLCELSDFVQSKVDE